MGHACRVTFEDVLVRYHRMLGRNTLVAARHRPRRHRHADGGRAPAGARGHDTPRPRARRVHRARLEVEGASRAAASASSCACSARRATGRASASRWTKGSRAPCTESFVRLHDEGLIYRATRLINWCVQLQTALSDLEVENEENVAGRAVRVRLSSSKAATTRSWSPPRAPRRCSATPRSRCTPTTRATQACTASSRLHPFVPRRIPIITDAVVGRPDVRLPAR